MHFHLAFLAHDNFLSDLNVQKKKELSHHLIDAVKQNKNV